MAPVAALYKLVDARCCCHCLTLVSFDGACRASDLRGGSQQTSAKSSTAAMAQNSVRHNLINYHVPIYCTSVVRNIVMVGCAETLAYAR
jgi:hypothetical protein